MLVTEIFCVCLIPRDEYRPFIWSVSVSSIKNFNGGKAKLKSPFRHMLNRVNFGQFSQL